MLSNFSLVKEGIGETATRELTMEFADATVNGVVGGGGEFRIERTPGNVTSDWDITSLRCADVPSWIPGSAAGGGCSGM